MENLSKQQLISKVKKLERKSKTGWRFYFEQVHKVNDLLERFAHLIDPIEEEVPIVNNAAYEMPAHILNELIELNNLAHREIECPVCFVRLTQENFHVTFCGHKICKNCDKHIKETTQICCICRTKLI